MLRHLTTRKNRLGIFIGQSNDRIENISHINIESEIENCKKLVVWSSPLIRCRETTSVLVQQLLDHNIDRQIYVKFSDNLMERNQGDFTGKSKKDIYAQYRAFVINGRLDPGFTPPNGESLEDFANRVQAFYSQLMEFRNAFPAPIVVSSHAHVFRALTCIHRKLDLKDNWDKLHFPNGTMHLL